MASHRSRYFPVRSSTPMRKDMDHMEDRLREDLGHFPRYRKASRRPSRRSLSDRETIKVDLDYAIRNSRYSGYLVFLRGLRRQYFPELVAAANMATKLTADDDTPTRNTSGSDASGIEDAATREDAAARDAGGMEDAVVAKMEAYLSSVHTSLSEVGELYRTDAAVLASAPPPKPECASESRKVEPHLRD